MTKTAQTQTSPIIEAKQYRDLLEDGFTIEQIAKRTGRKVAKINERLRLLNLDAAILKRCSKEAGFDYVAQEIARIPDFAAQKRALKVWDAREDKSNWGFVVLKAAVAGETHEYSDMYPGMAKQAREEGFNEIADWFETLAKSERSHANRFQKALDSL